MRPISLKMEGFASFRETVEIDFSGLDLFAICGVTGSGKTTIIDGMTFALYGATPRLGERRSGELIHQACRKAGILFEFSVAQGRFRIARTIQRRPSSLLTRRHLEQRIDGGWKSLASSERQVRERIKEIIGLDFAGFNRSIVLPQGQFDQFLKGSAAERRKILSDLLQLEVYERMGRLARQRSRELGARIEVLDQQLAARRTDPDKVTCWSDRIRELEEESREIRATLDQLSAADQLLRQSALERGRLGTLRARHENLKSIRQQLHTSLGATSRQLTRLAEEKEELHDEMKGLRYDEDLRLQLLSLFPRAEQKCRLLEKRQSLESRRRELRQQAEGSRIPAQELQARIDGLERQLEETACRLADSKQELAELEKTLGPAAEFGERLVLQEVRLRLRPGETCPVCDQPVGTPSASGTGGEAGSLRERAMRLEALRRLIQEATEAWSRLQQERADLEKSGQDMKLERELRKQAETSCLEELDRVAAELAGLESTLGEWSDPERLKQVLRANEEARLQSEQLAGRLGALEQSAIQAGEQVQGLESRLQENRRESVACGRDLARVETSLGETLGEVERILVGAGLAGDSEAERVVAEQRRRLDSLSTRVSAELGGCREKLAAARKMRAETRRLAGQRDESEKERQLFQQLALDLRASELVSFIQEEALGRLGEDASVHFHRLSGGRYRFTLSEGEFCVLDFWNGEEVRPAATLSGGESFLASLSLALALSESLTEFCSRKKHLHLDSLFLDEGVSTLDPETLDLVVQGIENLTADRRMIGIVSHLPELASRLPGRIQVSKSVEGSRVSVS